jgi:large conductance mechanosensitive channel
MFKEFRDFISKGNVLDLAVAVIIGAAFGKIISALVDSILTPLIGLIMGGVDFSGLAVKVGEASIGYGAFVQAIIDFLIVAFVLFLIVRAANRSKAKPAAKPAAPPEPPAQEKLLAEIRDLLKKQAR